MSNTCSSCFYYFGKNGSISGFRDERKPFLGTPSRNARKPFNGRLWTNVLIAINVFFCFFQVNCYSLNSVGPTMENIRCPRRFLAVYFTSAIASNNSYT
ncbi:hypothetical protein IFM89_002671 [Coptis chinensis]|uniref:Uncharacterized protein n=1 Tax=Coptis chinensis TaxID=261450 RepID=A0A835M401_9MAGN|nr:hypothetical protein IFM89_002671 [Coptis chinensis]